MWCFRKKAPGEKIRNPIQGEFFAAEAIDGPAEALVRESIQNSLDAKASECVHVRIALYRDDEALPGSAVRDLLDAAWPHYAAADNGLHAAPRPGSSCPFLVVEDFGTKGLTGDPTQSDPDPDPKVKNPFFLFFRAEALSGKSGTEIGRWGVGKYVFPRSSMASTHFGITVRHDDQRRLMLGSVTLKAHRIHGDNALYSPDGVYGKRIGKDSDFLLPIEEAGQIDKLCKLFKVSRRREPGLSVVVPFIDPEITYEHLLAAAAKDYFLPILNGHLTVEIIAGNKHARLSADTIEDVVRQAAAIGSGVPELISLAKFSIAAKPEERVQITPPDPSRAARWADDLVSKEAFDALKSKLDGNVPAAVRVPITVRPKEKGDQNSSFDVYFARDKHSDGRPVFVRDGIVISDVRGTRAREIRSLVVIEDTALSTMLGDSENPSHTQWQRDGSNFKGKYTYGPGVIQFVSESVGQLIAILSRRNAEADPSLTIDYFSIEPPADPTEEPEETDTRKPKPKPGPGPDKPKPEIPPALNRIAIRRDKGGFSVQPGTSPPQPPYLIDVRCAYDIRSGNPLKKWSSADFVLGPKGLPVNCTGHATVVDTRGNGALIRVDGPDYGVSVQGFDVDRDVYVRADLREAVNADQED